MGELAGLEQIWWPDHCIQGSEGAEFHPQLNAAYFDHIVHKGTDATIDSYSAFLTMAAEPQRSCIAGCKGIKSTRST